MLSISQPMGATQAEGYYYQEDQFLGKEGGGEIFGKTAEDLGLKQGDKIEKEQLSKLLAGQDMKGNQLRPEGHTGKERAANDLTFSAPKSVSILATQDPKVIEAHQKAVTTVLGNIEREYAECRMGKSREAVSTGNLAAVRFDHMVSRELDPQLHSHAVVMNITKGPDDQMRALNTPKLYQDQLYLGREYRAELAQNLQEIGYAVEITDRKQSFFEVKGVDKGLIEEFSTRREQIEEKMKDPAFKAMLAEKYPNASRAKQFEIATLGTRAAKDHDITREEIQSYWKEVCEAKGLTPEGVQAAAKEAALERQPEMSVLDKTRSDLQEKLIEQGGITRESQTGSKSAAELKTENQRQMYEWMKEQGHTQTNITFADKDKGAFERVIEADGKAATPRDYLKVAAGIITESESVFNRKDVQNEALRLSFGKYDTKTIAGAFDSLKKEGWIKGLDTIQQGGASREVFSTREMIQVEKEIVSMVRASKGQYEPSMTKEQAGEYLRASEEKQGWKLTTGQNKAVMTILTSTDRVNIIQGDAGVGKTTYAEQVLAINKAIGQGAKDQGRDVFALTGKETDKNTGKEVVGMGFTGKAAAELEGVGIKSSTIDSLLLKDIRFYEPGQKIENQGNTLYIARGSILIMDEASMTGSKHMYQILKLAEQGDLKLVIQGDKKQLPSISAGRMFEVLQKQGGVATVELGEILRQREGSHAYETVQTYTKLMALAEYAQHPGQRIKMQREAIATTLDTIKAQGNFQEIKKNPDLQRAVVKDYLGRAEKGNGAVLTERNADRKALNEQIREKLVDSGKVEHGQKHQVLASAGIGAAESRMANRYEPGMKITLNEGLSHSITRGFEGTVVSHDSHGNFITVKNDKTGKLERINAAAHGDKITAFTQEERNFGKGDQIVFLKNDDKLGVKNGNIGEIKSIDDRGNVIAKVHGIDKPVMFNLDGRAGQEKGDAKYNYKNVDQGYSVTVHKSQGTTYDFALIYHDAKHEAGNMKSFYVGLSRAKESLGIYTNDEKAFAEQIGRDLQKTSTTDYARQIRDDELGLKHQDKDQTKAQPGRAKIEAHGHKEQTGHKHEEATKEHHQGPTALGADSKIEQAEQAKTQSETSKGIEKAGQHDHGKAEQSKTSEKHQERTDSKQEHSRQQSDRGQEREREISL